MASDVPNVHDQIAEGLKDHPAKKGMRFNILVTLVEIGGVGPVVGGVAIWVKARKFSAASASIFALIASTTPKVLLYTSCGTPTAIFAPACT